MIALLALVSCTEATPRPVTRVPAPTVSLVPVAPTLPLPSPSPTHRPIVPGFPFVAAMPVPMDRANAANIGGIRLQFSALKALGFNAVAQSFAPTTNAYDWLAYLQAAEQDNLAVIATFNNAPPVWKESRFDLGINEAFLRAAQTQPSLYAFAIIDDPYNPKFNGVISTERLRALYRQVKDLAPNVRVMVTFNKSLARAETENNPNFTFKSGQCDICVISASEFRNTGDGNRFRRDDLLAQQRSARAVIKREDPRAQLWTNAQVFGATTRIPTDENSWYYMPKPDELQQMADLLWSSDLQARGKLDGILWIEWAWDWHTRPVVQATLGGAEFGAQREWVKSFAKRLGLSVP